MNTELHDGTQEFTKTKIGEQELECRLTARILKFVRTYPNITPALVKAKLGPFVPEQLVESTIANLVADGVLKQVPIKFALQIAE